MQKGRLIFLGNLSNEANVCAAHTTEVFQLNAAIIIGINHLREGSFSRIKVPLEINIGKNGEIEIEGINDLTVDDENIRIYSDRKVTQSEKEDLG